MLIDVSKRDLRIPVKFLPYLEKYNIYALFYEIARQLAIERPADHINYIRRILAHAADQCKVRQVILFAPPFLNLLVIAKQLASEINVKIIQDYEIDAIFDPLVSTFDHSDDEIAKLVKKMISWNHTDCKQGWLLIDFPKTKKEAIALQRLNVIPTHVMHFVPAFMAGNYIDDTNMPDEWVTYRKNLVELRQVYSKYWHDVSMSSRTVPELIKVCIDITRFNQRLRYPITPRILLIGCPGSGQKTIAKALNTKLGIIHVNFTLLLNRVLRNNKDPDYAEYQELKTNLNIDPSQTSRLHMKILMTSLLDQQCVDKGWVVTGFPNTLEDIKRLDKTETPPNRIFFLDCPEEICLQRMKKTTSCEDHTQMENKTHGQEIKDKFTVNESQLNIIEMSKYCGETASHINTSQSCTDVLNIVLALIMREAPISLIQRTPYEDYERLPCNKSPNTSHTESVDCLFKSTILECGDDTDSNSHCVNSSTDTIVTIGTLPDSSSSDNDD